MLAKKKLKKYVTKGIRKIKHRKGFGVHSPFAFSLITQVIDEKFPFYAYDQIRELRKKYVTSRLPIPVPGRASRKGYSQKQLFLLYRLINRFSPQRILEVNNNGGIATMVLSMPHSKAEVLSVGNQPEKMRQAARIIAGEKPRNVHLTEKDPVEALAELPAGYKADFILIHRFPKGYCAEQMFRVVSPRMHSHTLVLVEAIHMDPEMRKLWGLFKNDPAVRVTMDMYEVGLAVNHDKLYKQNYIVAF